MRRMLESRLEKDKQIFQINDDFGHWIDNDIWTEETDTGAVAEVDAPHGLIAIPTTAVGEDMSYLRSKQEHFLFQDKKPIHFEWEGYYNGAASHVADEENIFIGMMDDLTTGDQPMQDAGAGPKAVFSGFGFYKVADGVVWNTVIDNSTDASFAQRLTPLTLANQQRQGMSGVKQDADEDTLYRLAAECRPIGLVSALLLEVEFAFWINDILVDTHRGVMTLANFTAMHYGFGIHNDTATAANVEVTLFTDFAHASQERINSV